MKSMLIFLIALNTVFAVLNYGAYLFGSHDAMNFFVGTTNTAAAFVCLFVYNLRAN